MAYVGLIIHIVVNSKQYCDFEVNMFTEIQPKATDFALNQKGWFLMI